MNDIAAIEQVARDFLMQSQLWLIGVPAAILAASMVSCDRLFENAWRRYATVGSWVLLLASMFLAHRRFQEIPNIYFLQAKRDAIENKITQTAEGNRSSKEFVDLQKEFKEVSERHRAREDENDFRATVQVWMLYAGVLLLFTVVVIANWRHVTVPRSAQP